MTSGPDGANDNTRIGRHPDIAESTRSFERWLKGAPREAGVRGESENL